MPLKQPSQEGGLFPHYSHHLGLRGLRKLRLLVHREPLISYAILGVFEVTKSVGPPLRIKLRAPKPGPCPQF